MGTKRNQILAGKPDKQPKRTAQEWCDLGNDRLAGRIPYSDGKYEVRDGLHWFVNSNGIPTLGPKLKA